MLKIKIIDNNNKNDNNSKKRFPAHDELGTCETSLVQTKQPLVSILVRFGDTTQLTITHCNIIETGPRAAWRATR